MDIKVLSLLVTRLSGTITSLLNPDIILSSKKIENNDENCFRLLLGVSVYSWWMSVWRLGWLVQEDGVARGRGMQVHYFKKGCGSDFVKLYWARLLGWGRGGCGTDQWQRSAGVGGGLQRLGNLVEIWPGQNLDKTSLL